MAKNIILRWGQVISVSDESDGLRIRARIRDDNKTNTVVSPYAFPLLPKSFQVVPKVGEMVLILCEDSNNTDSNRYYIGPIISQPQFNYKDSYDWGEGTAPSLLEGGHKDPAETISHNASSIGAFPNVNDVAIVGRKGEDIILKDDEIDIRCAIREGTMFNNIDPAYIQLKHEDGEHKGELQGNSFVNVVADKINLISLDRGDKKDPLRDGSFNLTDNTNLIGGNTMDAVMSKLHKVPYGDLLVEALELMRQAIAQHVHASNGKPANPDPNVITKLMNFDFDSINSKNVRTS